MVDYTRPAIRYQGEGYRSPQLKVRIVAPRWAREAMDRGEDVMLYQPPPEMLVDSLEYNYYVKNGCRYEERGARSTR